MGYLTASGSVAGGYRCPRCGAPDAALNLLTSMTRYFACHRCEWRWQIAIVRDAEAMMRDCPEPSMA